MTDFYVVEVDTLVDAFAYDNSDLAGLKSYSIISVGESGAFEVDRAYRSIREALDSWPEAIPPRV